MSERISIEVGSVEGAMRLAGRLPDLVTEIVKTNGVVELAVTPDRDANELRVRVLDAVDAWLADDGLRSVKIRVDGHTYVVHSAVTAG